MTTKRSGFSSAIDGSPLGSGAWGPARHRDDGSWPEFGLAGGLAMVEGESGPENIIMLAPSDLFDLGGRTALVTGGATGIGKICAEAMLAAGARVLIASRKAEACEAAA